jgi:hypothetical protein
MEVAKSAASATAHGVASVAARKPGEWSTTSFPDYYTVKAVILKKNIDSQIALLKVH